MLMAGSHRWSHMNRVGLNLILVIMDNNSDNDNFESFLSKKEHKSYLLQHFSDSLNKSFTTISLGMKKLRFW